MIAFLIASLTALGSLAGGLIDPQSSSLFFCLAIALLCAWALLKTADGQIPKPNRPECLWVAGLSLLSGISVWASPIPSVATASWRTMLLGLWIFPAVSLVSKEQRTTIENAILLSAWALVILAIFQRLLYHSGEINALMPNPNIFAGLLIFLLPLALERKNIALGILLALCLLWTRSVGAWLGLAIAAIILQKQLGAKMRWIALAIAALCATALIRKFSLPDFPNRWIWWKAAYHISISKPWLGYGPGVFAYLLPLELKAHLLRSLYAHQYYLQTAGECGWPYLILFLAGIFFFFPKSPMKRLALMASLLCGLWDYSLSVPSIFWVFCYFAASEIPPTSGTINVSTKLKPAYALIILLSAWVFIKPAWGRWEEERIKFSALTLLDQGAPIHQVYERLLSALNWAPDPDAERLAAESEIKAINSGALSPQQGIGEAIQHLERSVKENPYRASTWEGLSGLYRDTGQKDKAEAAISQERHYCHPQ